MSRSAPASPFREDEDQDHLPHIQPQSHRTSVVLPVFKTATSSHQQAAASDQSVSEGYKSSSSYTASTATTSSSSSYSAPNSPSGPRRVIVRSVPNTTATSSNFPLPPSAATFVLNHPQLQRLREESSDNNRRISLCRFSLSQAAGGGGNGDPRGPSSSSSTPVLIQTLTGPRARSFSHSFANFSQSFPTFGGHPIRSSTICVSFSPGGSSSSLSASGSITVRRTRTDPSVGFKSSRLSSAVSSSGEQDQDHQPDHNNIITIGNSHNNKLIQDMNLNRQQSAPVPPNRPSSDGRQLSVEMPQRPASASPTAIPKVMRLVPIMQPVEAGIDDDSDPFSRPNAAAGKQQQLKSQSIKPNPQPGIVTATPAISGSYYPNQVFTSQQSQANYIQSLLEHQHKRLLQLEEQVNMMEYNVNVKQASIRLRERDVYKVQIKSTDMVAFSQMERLMKVWEEVRELKVSIICYVNEIDHHGDHYLGDLDLRKVVAGNTRRPVGWIPTAAAAAPPLPPRPVKTGKPGQKPHFCLLEMRVPTSVACTPASPVPVRKVSTGSNTLTPLNDGPAGAGFQRSTSQGYSSMQTPDDHPNRRLTHEEEDEENDQWLCTSCTFQNHPRLNMCEVCEKPKDHYVPKSPSPIPSPGNNYACACNNNSNQTETTVENENVVNFVYLTHDLLNRPFVLIPVPLTNSASSHTSDILTALSSLSTQLNLIFPSCNVTTTTTPRSLTNATLATAADANANLNDNESPNTDLTDNSNANAPAANATVCNDSSHPCNPNICYHCLRKRHE